MTAGEKMIGQKLVYGEESGTFRANREWKQKVKWGQTEKIIKKNDHDGWGWWKGVGGKGMRRKSGKRKRMVKVMNQI